VTITTKKLLVAVVLWATCAQASITEDIAKRVAPVGQVCMQGKACPGVVAAHVAGGATAARAPDEVIGKHCSACHTTGLLEAPKIGDTAAWAKRAGSQGGLDGLLAKAITGVNAMPPRGTCMDCSDDDLKAAIKKMSGL
jgi:cytochrome c5